MIPAYLYCKKILIASTFTTISLLAQFNTLQDLQHYAATHDENIRSDNKDQNYPDFTTAYQAKKPTLFKSIKNYFSKNPIPEVNADAFKTLLDELIALRAQHTTAQDKIITLPVKGTVVFWGCLYGSYHSLVRTLTELYNQKILDADLKIIKQDCYLAFLGDAINFSPYSLETLAVILTLMKKNPENVIYLKGQQEKNGYWENFNIRYALKTFANHLVSPEDLSIPLSSLIKKFFKTLPDILILRNPTEKNQAFYAAHVVSEKILRAEEVEAALFGEREFITTSTSGLDFIDYENGSAIWSIMSCPNPLYQDFYKFYYDSFVIFEMGERLVESTLTVFNQDVRTKNGFTSEMFDILYAIPLQNNDEAKKVHRVRPVEIGSTMPLSGGEGVLGHSISGGINASMHNYNKTEASQLNLFIRNNIFDDQLVPRIAKANIKALHNEYKIDYFLLPAGTSTLSTYIANLEKEDIFVFFPFTGWSGARNPLLKNIINIRCSFQDEVNALIDYMVTHYRSKRFAFFYQNDSYGKDSLEAAHTALTKQGITTWTDIPYNLDQTDFNLQVKEMRKASPDAVGFFSNSTPTREFINQMGTDFFMGVNLFGISFLESLSLRLFLKQQGLPFTFSSVFSDPVTSSIPLFKEYRNAMDRLGLQYSADSLEGYIATELFLDAIIHIKPKIVCDELFCAIAPQEKRAIMNYLESLKNYNFKGLTLTFDPKTRSFNLPVWIETEDGQWIEYDSTNYQRITKKDRPQ